MPKISIITITYNNLEGLTKTFRSVFGQTYKDFEYIVIDGGSTDGSRAFIEENKDRLTHWVSEPDKGIYNAMNKGIKAASGEYLLFLNSGDELNSENVLSDHKDSLDGEEIIFFNLRVVSGSGSNIRTYPKKLNFSFFLKESLPHPSTFIRAECFQKSGYYDETLKIVSDWKFFIVGICRDNLSYKYNPNVMAVHYLDGISSDPKNSKVIKDERSKVLVSEFNSYIKDLEELEKTKKTLENLRKSRKIQLMVKMGLINKF